jgi:hypothetical protein
VRLAIASCRPIRALGVLVYVRPGTTSFTEKGALAFPITEKLRKSE